MLPRRNVSRSEKKFSAQKILSEALFSPFSPTLNGDFFAHAFWHIKRLERETNEKIMRPLF